jgi:hypothetical protein
MTDERSDQEGRKKNPEEKWMHDSGEWEQLQQHERIRRLAIIWIFPKQNIEMYLPHHLLFWHCLFSSSILIKCVVFLDCLDLHTND